MAGGVFASGHLGELTRIVPFEMVDAVLAETGSVQQRLRLLRLLPSRVVVYLLLAAGLFTEIGWSQVWTRLCAGLDGLAVAVPSSSALAAARARVGVAPLRALFDLLRGAETGCVPIGAGSAARRGVFWRVGWSPRWTARSCAVLCGHPGDVGVAKHVRVQGRHPHPGRRSQDAQPSGGGMSVHPDTAGVQQDRTASAVADRLVQGSSDRGWQWDEDGLAAFAEDPYDAVTVLFAEVGDVQAGRFEDPQPK